MEVREKLLSLPPHHFLVLLAVASLSDSATGERGQPLTSRQLQDGYEQLVNADSQVGERSLRNIVTDLETMELVDSWMESRGRGGRAKQLKTAVPSERIAEMQPEYFEARSEVRQETSESSGWRQKLPEEFG